MRVATVRPGSRARFGTDGDELDEPGEVAGKVLNLRGALHRGQMLDRLPLQVVDDRVPSTLLWTVAEMKPGELEATWSMICTLMRTTSSWC